MGVGTAGAAAPNARFGEGMGKRLWLDEVSCRGNEARVEECAHAGWGVSNWCVLPAAYSLHMSATLTSDPCS